MKNPILRIAAVFLLLWTVADLSYRVGQTSVWRSVREGRDFSQARIDPITEPVAEAPSVRVAQERQLPDKPGEQKPEKTKLGFTLEQLEAFSRVSEGTQDHLVFNAYASQTYHKPGCMGVDAGQGGLILASEALRRGLKRCPACRG